MMRRLVGTSLRSRWIVLGVTAVVMVLGALALWEMPRDVLPEFSPPTVEVQTEALGLSAAEVEQLITVPLEQDLLNGVAFLNTISSRSMPGLSSIQMVFEPGTDLLDARQVVEERLTQAHALPQVSKPPQMLQPVSSTSRVMMVRLSSHTLSLIDLSILAQWTIRPRLMGVPGVANVAVWGQQDRQLQVLVDPERLRDNGVTLQQVIESTANAQFVSNLTFVEASTPGTGGIIETPTQRFGVQHAVPFASPADLAKVVVEGTEDSPLRLGDVTDIAIDHQQLIGDAVLDGDGLLLVVERLPGASTAQVTDELDSALEALRPGLPGVEMDASLYRPQTFIERSSHNVTVALLVAGVLLLLALGLWFVDWRAAVVVAASVLASLLVAAFVLSRFEASLNAMVVAGLVLGLVAIVHDAVGDVERMRFRLQRRRIDGQDGPRMAAILGATVEMRTAALSAAMITVVALVPTFFPAGPFGAFFSSVATAFAVAVAASMAVALVATPALGMVLLRPRSEPPRDPLLLRWVRPAHERALSMTLGRGVTAIALAGILLAAGLVSAPFLRRSFTPSFQDPNLLVRVQAAAGTSLPETDRISSRLGAELRSIPGVLSVGGTAGRAALSDRRVDTNVGELWVAIDPDADYGETRSAIDRVARGYPGIRVDVTTYPSERIAELLPKAEAPLTVRIFGEDLDILRTKAEEVRAMLQGVDGVRDLRIESQEVEPTLQIRVDLGAAERHGVLPGDVRRAAATLLSGLQVGSLFDEQKVFDVVVWGTPAIRHDLSAVEGLSIDTRSGGRVRLSDVADVRVGPYPTAIRHSDVSRSIDVTAATEGRSLGALADDVEQHLHRMQFPLEYHAELVGDFAEEQAAGRETLGFAVGAAIAIFLLLLTNLGGWRLAAMTFLALPLGAAGGAVAALLDGRMLSIGSVAGFLAILGLTALHAVTQVRQLHARVRDGHRLDGRTVRGGARERLGPVLASGVATAAVFLPFALAGAIPGLEVLHPMAVVILGGLVSSTLVALFVVPALFLRFGATSETDLASALAPQPVETPPAPDRVVGA